MKDLALAISGIAVMIASIYMQIHNVEGYEWAWVLAVVLFISIIP